MSKLLQAAGGGIGMAAGVVNGYAFIIINVQIKIQKIPRERLLIFRQRDVAMTGERTDMRSEWRSNRDKEC